jgi:hypothetical protein
MRRVAIGGLHTKPLAVSASSKIMIPTAIFDPYYVAGYNLKGVIVWVPGLFSEDIISRCRLKVYMGFLHTKQLCGFDESRNGNDQRNI